MSAIESRGRWKPGARIATEDTTELRTERRDRPPNTHGAPSRLRRMAHRDPGKAPMRRKSGLICRRSSMTPLSRRRRSRLKADIEGGTAGYEQYAGPR